jgi:lipopolysaccharide biosynthesis regulator YciM
MRRFLEEIKPEDKTRNEVLGARVNLYLAAKKWDMAAAVASHLVKVEPEKMRLGGSASLIRSGEAKVLKRQKPFC